MNDSSGKGQLCTESSEEKGKMIITKSKIKLIIYS
jgi:hypothetical protein